MDHYTSVAYIDFEYTIVPPGKNSTPPLTADLTCTEVRRIIYRLSTGETTDSPPEQTIVRHSGVIPLIEPINKAVFEISRNPNGASSAAISTSSSDNDNNNNNNDNNNNNSYSQNCARISQIMHRFGVSDYGCSVILGEMDRAILTSSSRGRGVIQVKIWKIKTRVYKLIHTDSIRVFKYSVNSEGSTSTKEEGCVICMEDYTQGSVVAKLACNHDFHGVCIDKWSQINHQCPMCRFPITY